MSHHQTDKAADELLDRGPLPSLAWGLPSLVPETARAAWGARAIVHGACTRMTGVLQLGRLDIPSDRPASGGDLCQPARWEVCLSRWHRGLKWSPRREALEQKVNKTEVLEGIWFFSMMVGLLYLMAFL